MHGNPCRTYSQFPAFETRGKLKTPQTAAYIPHLSVLWLHIHINEQHFQILINPSHTTKMS